MSYQSMFGQVMREYETARDNASRILEERVAEVYAKLPQVKELDLVLNRLGASLARLALSGDVAGIEAAKKEISGLQAQRRILLEANFGANFLETVYGCSICKDTGFTENNRCVCLKQRLINEYYNMSNMKEVLREENFDTFDLRLFSTDIVQSEGLSPHANMQTIYRLATKFVTHFDTEFSNLLLYGEPGTGKTFVSHAIAKDLLDAGRTVLYQTAPRLSKLLEDYRFNRAELNDPGEMLNAVDSVDLLILDDLGAEISTVITSAAIFDIINQRLLSRKHTVISTNLSPGGLEAQYSERLVSRFFGNYQMIKFFGEDIRVKKKYHNLA